MFGRKETRFDAAENQAVVSKQFLLGFGKSGDQFLFASNSLPVEFIFTRALKRYDGDVLLSETQRFANLAQLPTRFALNMQDSHGPFNHSDERVLSVVVDRDFAIERRDFNCVAMEAGRGRHNFKLDCLRITAAQIEHFSLDRASIFSHVQQNFRRAVAAEADKRINVSSRSDQHSARYIYSTQLRVQRTRRVTYAYGKHRHIARAQFSQRGVKVTRYIRSTICGKDHR